MPDAGGQLLTAAGGLLAVTTDKQHVYTASILGTKVYDNGVAMPLAWPARLGLNTNMGSLKLVSIVVMERPAYANTIVASVQLTWLQTTCYAVVAASVSDNVIRAIMHYDIELGAPVLLSSCQASPILLATTAHTSTLFLAWDTMLSLYDISGTDSTTQSVSTFPLGSPGISALAGLPTGEVLVSDSKSVFVISGIPSPTFQTLFTVQQGSVTGLTGAGRRLWYLTSDGAVNQYPMPPVSTGGCMAGYTRFPNGPCMQAGYGRFSSDGGIMSVCPAGLNNGIACSYV